MKALRVFLFLLLLATTYVTVLFHRVVLAPPTELLATAPATNDAGRWYPKSEYGLNQLFVSGSPFQRGIVEGRLTRSLLKEEEVELIQKLNGFFPNPVLRWGLLVGLMRWFWGIDRYFEDWTLQEMYGVSQSAPSEFNYLMDPYTRQLAYHGLHEVGQMFVDAGNADKGCTLFAVPLHTESSRRWVLGRNFDFEGGRIFDEEKIIKWVTPDKGFRYVSVIWAGMVGAVTGVNEKGVYVSINAAGSNDFRRQGTPTTLVVLKSLQFASTAEEAVAFLKSATTFITDIFVVADDHHVFLVEKSPKRVAVTEWKQPSVVTNQLSDAIWENDSTNEFRRRELTSDGRYLRGESLLSTLTKEEREIPAKAVSRVLQFLRDKSDPHGKRLALGNRTAIDSLIASHSVIYDSERKILFVSQGPSVSGKFIGFDLVSSFKDQGPAVVAGTLPSDTEITPEIYAKVKKAETQIDEAEKKIGSRHCEAALPLLEVAKSLNPDNYRYFSSLGDYYLCLHQTAEARTAWEKALSLSPAYLSERRILKEKLK